VTVLWEYPANSKCLISLTGQDVLSTRGQQRWTHAKAINNWNNGRGKKTMVAYRQLPH